LWKWSAAVPDVLRLSRRHIALYGPVAIGLLVTFFTLLVLQGLPAFGQAELSTYDWQFLQRGYIGTPANVEMVEVDAPSVAYLGQHIPVPRKYVAQAITHLKRAGAKVIALDFEYIAPSIYGKADDRAMVAALKHAKNVVLTQRLEHSIALKYIAATTQVVQPIDAFSRYAAGVGLANYPQDIDGAIRRATLLQQGPGGPKGGTKPYPILPVAIASVYLHKPVSQIVKSLPPSMLINYIGPSSMTDNSVQSWERMEFDDAVTGEFPASDVKGKIALVIPADLDFKDQLTTPFGGMWGGYVQANTLGSILRHVYYTPVGNLVNNVILVLLGLITTLAASRLGVWRGTLATLLVAAAYVGLDMYLFREFNLWANLVTPEASLVLAYAGIMGFRFATEERLKRKTSKAFGLYLRPEVVDLLVGSEDPTKALTPSRRDISVLFVDVRGFTSMSEHMQPEEVVSTLDVYLEELTASVQESGGTLNKYVGDEIMAMWNTPIDQPDHAIRAVRCALDMVARGERINSQLGAAGRPRVFYGIGVNSGEAVVGQMGSTFRKQFDVIGDTVNTGARLCSAAGGMETIIGQGTWEAIGQYLTVEETEPLRLKGKSDQIRTFKVLALQETAQPASTATPAVSTSPV
jgi:adenylate cyclase